MVTVTVAQSFTDFAHYGYVKFYAWANSHGFVSVPSFTADESYVGGSPIYTFDPDEIAGDFNDLFLRAVYAQRYVTATGFTGLGSLDDTLNNAHWDEAHTDNVYDAEGVGFGLGGFSIGRNYYTAPYDVYDFAIIGPLGLFWGKIGGSDVLGTYDLLGGGMPIVVAAGGFDP